MWHQLSSDNHFLGCWVCRLKKVNLFLGFSFFGKLRICPSSFSMAHIFSHLLGCKMSSISASSSWQSWNTHTHIWYARNLLLHPACVNSLKIESMALLNNFFWPSIALCLQASVRRRSIGFQPVRHEWASGLQPEPIPDLQIYGIFFSIFIAVDSSFGLELKQC